MADKSFCSYRYKESVRILEQTFQNINMKETDTDYLTGLLDRRGLHEIWAMLSGDMKVHGIFIDVDNFKRINDIYGHSKGDELLVYVADLLRKTFEGQIVARLGGDEFAVICHGDLNTEQIKKQLPVLQDGLKDGGFDKTIADMISFSIGVVFYHEVWDGLTDLLKQCDEAMYHVKQNGKGHFIVYNQISDMVKENMAMKDRALIALEKKEIQILLRPVIYLQTSEVYAAEVVLFWDFPDIGVLSQDKFIPIFVKYGVVTQLDAYVFEQVCRWKESWKGTAYEHLDIYVRVSGQYILKDEGIDNIRACLTKYQVKTEEIELCIEEKDFMEHEEQLHHAVQMLIDMGFKVAINNFGSASSFRVLQNIPSQILKLDTKLSVIEQNEMMAMQILKNVISLGRDLRKDIVGQGIENAGQVSALANYGAQFGTGDFYGRPQEESAFRKKYADQLYLLANKYPVIFPFEGDLKDSAGEMEGIYNGTGFAYDRGVVQSQGALVFPGGGVKKNVIEFPKHLMHSDSYSICFWINPVEVQAWTSAVYVMFADGFLSLIPTTDMGFCFRIKDDREPNVWYDIFGRHAVPGEWSYICATYDSVIGISKLYFNGLLVGSRENVPCLKLAQKVMLGGDEYQKSFEGRIGGLEIYHYVISASHVQNKFLEYQSDKTFLGTDGRK